jgi:predicted AAA+ superfamily ATPase
MSLKPWREIAQPHEDVLKGNFQEAEFAADITQVAEGIARDEYQDPIKFFSRTYITEGMELLLDSVAKRMVGKGGDPVIQLQTAFGGGKTHTMLAVYHLVKGNAPVSSLLGISPILDKAGITEFPKANVAVIDGTNLSVSKPRDRGRVKTHTLWGELAWQLGGEAGYAIVEVADKEGTSPGKDQLIQLLTTFSPAVILVDELVAYMRQFGEGKSYSGGTFDTNLSFIQALTEGIKSVPKAILLASLPESDTEVGSTQGRRAQDVLEKVFGRVNAIWKPVATEEAFEIVRRRLFEPISDTEGMSAVCQAFTDFYQKNAESFPNETQEIHYCTRIVSAYPIHPEIFDRLYEDWSTLDKFQRTRGVLQYMALIIYRLWQDDNKDLLIMPGSIPLYDHDVKNKSIYYLPQGWDPVIEKDIDGERSESYDIDRDSRFGSIQAARRVSRTIFLGSAPSVTAQMVRGIEMERVCLGAAQPGQQIAIYKDVLRRLQDRLHYLNSGDNRYWFDTRPNLRKEMEERKRRFDYRNDILPLIKTRINELYRQGDVFGHVHIFTDHNDIPDDYFLRLVILPPEHKFGKSNKTMAIKKALEILQHRGQQPRVKQNRLIFLAPDYDQSARLNDQAKTVLAWNSIVEDCNNMKLNLDQLQIQQAKQNLKGSRNSMLQTVRDTYKWLLAPVQYAKKGKGVGDIEWEEISISGAGNAMQEIEHRAIEQEWVINRWSPFHLSNLLDKWFFTEEKKDITTMDLWNYCAQYIYFPRLLNERVLTETIEAGIESEDFFGFAYSKDGNKYNGFTLGTHQLVNLDNDSVIIEINTARAYKEKLLQEEAAKRAEEDAQSLGSGYVSDKEQGIVSGAKNEQQQTVQPADKVAKKRFFGNIELDPLMAKANFQDIMDEIINQFTADMNVNVKISVEIEATTPTGFDENIQRAVKENCSQLKFDTAEFEEA